ncbi:coiled-coil domain-containing protein 74B [Vipera latastei]
MQGSGFPPLGHLPHWPRAGQAERPGRPFAPGAPGPADAAPPPTPPPRRAAPELERSLQFLQQQHGETLRLLHQEIDRLKRRNQDLQYRLIMQPLLQQASSPRAAKAPLLAGTRRSGPAAAAASWRGARKVGGAVTREGLLGGRAPPGSQPGSSSEGRREAPRGAWAQSRPAGTSEATRLERLAAAAAPSRDSRGSSLGRTPREKPPRNSVAPGSDSASRAAGKGAASLQALHRSAFLGTGRPGAPVRRVPSRPEPGRPADRWKEGSVPPEAAEGLAGSGLCPASVAAPARVCERAPRRLPPVADAEPPEQKASKGERLAEEEAAPEGSPEWETDADGLGPEPQAAAAAAATAAAAAPGRDIVDVCERRMSPLSLPRPSASQSRAGDVRIPAASSNPFLVNVLPSYMRKPPSLEECEVVIRQLWNINHMQMQELMYLRSCLDDIHKTKRIPEDYMLAGQLGSQESTKLPRVRNAPKKCRILTPLPAAERAVLPALKQTLGNAFAERQKRAQAVQRNRLHRTAL